MKKLILSFVFVTVSSLYFAQGNLQFNQVQRIKSTGLSPLGMSVITSITVPANKTWKIESGSVSNSTGVAYTEDNFYSIYVDEQVIYSKTSVSIPAVFSPPIWLGPGTYQIKLANRSSPQNYVLAISAIEFNVVP